MGPHTISVPRIRPASDVSAEDFDNAVQMNNLLDRSFLEVAELLRYDYFYTESQDVRGRVLELGFSNEWWFAHLWVAILMWTMRSLMKPLNLILLIIEHWMRLYTVDDTRSYSELLTACYRSGPGDRFMSFKI